MAIKMDLEKDMIKLGFYFVNFEGDWLPFDLIGVIMNYDGIYADNLEWRNC